MWQMKEARARGMAGLLVLIFVGMLSPGFRPQHLAVAQIKPPVRDLVTTDPVFGISYHESEAHYDILPASIHQICHIGAGQYWIYADLHRDGSDYLIVSGIPQHQDGDLFGSAIEVSNGHCASEDSTWMLSGNVPPGGYSNRQVPVTLPGLNASESCDKLGNCHFMLRSPEEEESLRALVSNAVARGIRAWGSESRFAARACAPDLMLSNSLAPVLQSTLKKFCDAHR